MLVCTESPHGRFSMLNAFALTESKGFTRMKISYSNGDPIYGAIVTLKKAYEQKIHSQYVTDTEGLITISEQNVQDFSGGLVNLNVFNIGLAGFDKTLYLRKGVTYNFKSIYPEGYSLAHDKYDIEVIKINEDSIVFKTPLKKTVTFKKVANSCSCAKSIFTPIVTDIK